MGARVATHVPIRSCCACRKRAPKEELIRFFRSSENRLEIDEAQRSEGRGAYVCPSLSCFERALKKGSFARTLRSRSMAPNDEELRARLERLLARRAPGCGESWHE
ncbi:MAG: YlxR family protein [Deltaproteobacteria bacterium]|nr:YlxR family protein [Deltaproteobacteria bacterium]